MLSVDIKVNGEKIERLEFVRQEPLAGTDETWYTYDVRYMRTKGHRTSPGFHDKRVQVYHKFSDGSLVLIARAIAELFQDHGDESRTVAILKGRRPPDVG